MPWLERGNRHQRYYYRYENGKKRYVGSASSPAAVKAATEDEHKRTERKARKEREQELRQLDEDMGKTRMAVRALIDAHLLLNRFTYRQGEWRKSHVHDHTK